ncbi:uncharacterized protein TRIREDRAFT_62658 [Trichoderma reesei QM6a]|uniref:Predicted protein n=2 Tax=Hypocrea jecorina TaxID=51453 RepID=G0RKT1_HYPJQ|nr:uncharacterized protein TRIREDRAFT_62658 [Trichoderma reesei QM6a]EGR48451.1 predicted protein [Trichoderma reesei QM6a]ETS07127.1 hypothetical protein M419DRAFT_67656 [Trichoderma reesei RUT C-30]
MLFALVFICTRLCQIVTLIPPVGMLSWFVAKFNDANVLTPDAILVLFIVTVLALAWCLFTLVAYSRSSHNALFVSFVDLCFLGALIAGIYFLRAIQWTDCSDPSSSREVWYYRIHDVGIPGFRWSVDKPCAMLKASWAFAIMNTVFFAVTALAAFAHGDSDVHHHHRDKYVVREVRRSSHSHGGRHSHRRSHSGSRSHHSGYDRGYHV